MDAVKLLFIGFSFDKNGPYFVLEDILTRERYKMHVVSKTFTLEKTEQRFCIGTYELTTFQSAPCEKRIKLSCKDKGNQCEECQRKTGFNPAFYHAKNISPQQTAYNSLPHVVYMAYFAPGYVKVGIASERRHSIRLLEQGARAALVLEKYPNAQLARNLEASLCSKPDIRETLSSNLKLQLISESSYSFEAANRALQYYTYKYSLKTITDKAIDLDPFYFCQNKPQGIIKLPIGAKADTISGKVIGMIGDTIILEQKHNDTLFAVSVKKYISHEIMLYVNEMRYEYEAEPKQLSLWG